MPLAMLLLQRRGIHIPYYRHAYAAFAIRYITLFVRMLADITR